MALPKWLARFNRVATNRAARLVAGRVPGLGMVVHEGRKSGTTYRTPVNVFRRDGGFAVALTYGSSSQWVRNVLAAGKAQIVANRKTYDVVNPRVEEDPRRRFVPAPVRLPLAVLNVDEFLLVDADDEVSS